MSLPRVVHRVLGRAATEEFCCLSYGYKTRCATCPRAPGDARFEDKRDEKKFARAVRASAPAQAAHAAVLGLSAEQAASETEVKRAFRAAAKRWHPDAGRGSEADFVRAREAFLILLEACTGP
jgi:epoxyqueuosine reductase QueG